MDAPIASSPRGELAPTIILVGDIVVKVLEYAEHLDFLLSVRDEKVAVLLEIYRNFGWWVIGLASIVWLVYEIVRRKKDVVARGSVGSLLASAVFVSFLLGCVITVRATGSLPNIIMNYGGGFDPAKQEGSCTADIDTSRLAGFADDDRLVLICGIVDPSIDYLDDVRIAVSAPFHITANSTGVSMVGIVAPLGKLADTVGAAAGTPPPGATPPFSVTFQLWHTVALIPKDVQGDSIKKASDIKQVGGRIITEGVHGSGMAVPLVIQTPTQQTPTPAAPNKKQAKN